MKINSIKTRQFAGLHNKDVNFKDGINVIYGKNESGKSTLVNLMSSTLFQDVKLHKTQDKDFINSYFPTSKKGSDSIADYINGEIEFETKDGKYNLEKKWSLKGKEECFLDLPNNSSIEDNDEINRNVVEALGYGEGVYSNVLLSSQKNTNLSLKDVLSEDGDIKNDLVDVLTTAFVQDADVSMDAIENRINEKIDDLAGKYWDIEDMRPTSNKRMKNSVGTVLKAYYDLEDAEEDLKQMSEYEDQIQDINEEYKDINEKHIEAKDKYDSFSKISSSLKSAKLLQDKLDNDKEKKKGYEDVLKDWPVLDKNYKCLIQLNEELDNRLLISDFDKAKKLNDTIIKESKKLDDMLNPTEKEIDEYVDSSKELNKLNGQLSGMNIKASIKMLDNHEIEIKSVLNGEEIPFKNDIDIKEAVDINIPGVMNMSLIPKDINVEDIKTKIKEYNLFIEKINKKYKVESEKELRQLVNEYKEANCILDGLKKELEVLLDGKEFKDLEKQVKAIKIFPREETKINEDIIKICENEELDRYLIIVKQKLDEYTKNYKNIDELKQNINSKKESIDKTSKELSKINDIPKEFKDIDDPDEYLDNLKKDYEYLDNELKDTLIKKEGINRNYENFLDSLEDDPKIYLEECQKKYDEEVDLLKHWMHIKKIFDEEKSKVDDNPLVSLAKNFTSYLNEMTNNRVESELPKQDKLDINIYSDNSKLDYDKLSEGTKETVSLAFRLAVLDHLFPSGGGIAVFDDSLANMDEEREEKAINIIKKFAKKHQVIFLTCKEDTANKLGGNIINI